MLVRFIHLSLPLAIRVNGVERPMEASDWLLLAFFPIFFVTMWLLVVTILRLAAKMTRTIDVDTGPMIRESGWGSGKLNWVNANNCLKLAEHENGWMLRTMWVLGGGKLWLPKNG